MQDKSGKLEHVGIIHHDPAGSPAFLHRTSGGKMDLLSDAYFTVDFITQPLSPQRAYVLFEGAAEVGNYRYPRHRFSSLGTSRAARQTRSPPLEQESFQVYSTLISRRWQGQPTLASPVLPHRFV